MSDATKVEDSSDDPAPAPEEVEATDDPKTKEFQEKYYPLSPSPVNKYDPYTLQSTIDTEIIQVSYLVLSKCFSPDRCAILSCHKSYFY